MDFLRWNFVFQLRVVSILIKTQPSLQVIIEQFHSSTHEGFHETFHGIRAKFYSNGLRKRVQEVIRACDVCQRHKVENLSRAGLLQPLPGAELH